MDAYTWLKHCGYKLMQVADLEAAYKEIKTPQDKRRLFLEVVVGGLKVGQLAQENTGHTAPRESYEQDWRS